MRGRSAQAMILLTLCLSLLYLDCIHSTTGTIEPDAILQVRDFFETQNKLHERQKHYVFQDIVEVRRLDRKKAEVVVQYVFFDQYMTVDQTAEIRQSTFLLEWQEQGRLVVPPEGEAERVHWVLIKTWDYRPGENSP